MDNGSLRKIIESKIEVYKTQWYNTSKYSIDELVSWFIDIGNSVSKIPKLELNIKDKRKISKIFSMWFESMKREWEINFLKAIQNINRENIKESTNEKIIIDFSNSFIKQNDIFLKENFEIYKEQVENDYIVKDWKLNTKYLLQKKYNMSELIDENLIYNYEKVINYSKDKKWDEYILIYKNILLDYYKIISYSIETNKIIMDDLYDKGRLFFYEEDVLNIFQKISNLLKKLKLNKEPDNIVKFDFTSSYYTFLNKY